MAFFTPGQVSNIPKKPLTPPTEWTRPGDWISITDNVNKIQMLVSDIGTQSFAGTGATTSYTINSIFTRTGATYSIYIDWGDGSSDQVSTTTTTNTSHDYTTGGTTCSRGYNTWVITITVDPTVSLTTCNLIAPVNLGSPLNFPSGLLELYHGDTIASALTLTSKYSNGTLGNYSNLEYVKLPTTWTGSSLASAFTNCFALQKVILPTTMNSCTSMASCFSGCVSLKKITMPESATLLNTLALTFNGCSELYLVSFPPSLTLNAVTTFNSTFLDCVSIDNLTIPSTNTCSSFSAAFARCYSLTNMKLTALRTSGTIDWTNAFLNSQSLVRADIPTTSGTATWNCGNMLQDCKALAYFSFPATLTVNNFSGTFNGCSNIVRIDMPTTLNGSFTMASFAYQCYNLTYITFPSAGSPTPTSMLSAFTSCAVLTSVVFPSNWVLTSLTDLNSTFLSSGNLQTISFPASAANSITTLNRTFESCFNLTSVQLPTSLNACTTITSCFNSCYALTSITLPSSMPALTGTGLQTAFQNCRSLTSLTLPTTVVTNGITNMTSCFNGCNSLTSITLPVLGTGVTSFATAFQDTWNLKTLNFNTGTMSNAAISATSMLLRSGVNTLLNTSSFGTTASLIDATTLGNTTPFCATYSFSTRFSKLDISGVVANRNTFVRTLRLPAVALTGQWGGTSPQINISYTGITYTNLVALFNDMAAQGNIVGKTINITSATGAASLTAGDRLIITSKGWTITG
jgi:hypothetical protein